MPSELDIYRTARMYIDLHGEKAEAAAAKRADELWTIGDLSGARVWLRVQAAICELRTARSLTNPLNEDG